MRVLSFTIENHISLSLRLSNPFEFVSIKPDDCTGPTSITLWYSDGVGLRIRSRMNDIGEREEIGVLDFSLVTTPDDDEQRVEVPGFFNKEHKVYKLFIQKQNVNAESGISLQSDNNMELIIVSGAFPYSLAVNGLPLIRNKFDPEYPMENYIRSNIA